jgi:hypothetical protein
MTQKTLQLEESKTEDKMLEELYMRDLADAMKVPAEPLPTGKVTVSGPQVETQPKQPEMGTITGIPQTAFEKALETSGVKLSELGDMIDQSAPGTLNTLLGREVPIIGNLKLRDFLPFVGSKDEGKLTGTPAALIAAGTGQPLRGQPVVGSSIGPDGQRYYGTSGSPAMLSEDVGTAVVDVATLGLGKPLATAAKKAVKATKNMPVGMSTKAVGQGVDELGFYSAAKQAVDAIQQPKGTGQQFLKQIEKTPGVKPDEIKWTGLDEFLQSKKSVTKAEVQEYLDKNRVEIKEVQLGGVKINDKSEYALPEVMKVINENQGSGPDGIRLALVNDYDAYQALTKKFPNLEDTDNWGDRVVADIIGSGEGGTKFSKWQLPGGENYREIFMTLPPKLISEDEARVILGAAPDAKLSEADIFYASRKKQDDYIVPRAHSSGMNEGDINRIAHLRLNDRVIDGKKTLFVEEVQSDWHQAGRKKGYIQPDLKPEDVRAEFIPPNVPEGANPDNYPGYYEVFNKKTGELVTRAGGGLSPERAIQEAIGIANATKSGVPDAPFKTTWSDLSMKRVIQMASEGGYDRIAFTTGKTQTERFDLSKQIDEVYYKKNSDGTYKVEAVGKDSRAYLGENYSPEQLEENIGKELTKKIVADQGKNIERSDLKSLSGVDLKVGGEGMKGFYDDILPKFLDKYAKKWDAKTGMTSLTTDDIKFQEFYNWALKKDKSKSYSSIQSSFKKKDNLYKDFAAESPIKGDEVHYIDVTPKMRESVVTKGQPMFAIGAGGAGAAATQEENK